MDSLFNANSKRNATLCEVIIFLNHT